MTGGCNYYRATPLKPPSNDDAPRALPGSRRVARTTCRRVSIWGERDRALTTGLVDGLELVCTDLDVRRVADASHWIVHEQPDRVNALIREFIAR